MGTRSMHEELSATLQAAIGAGMGYLSRAVEPTGAWPASVFWSHDPIRGVVTHHPPFVAALGAMSLAPCRHLEAAPLRERTLAFLRATREPTGRWRYAQFVPPDADDTSICGLALADDDQPGPSDALTAAPRNAQGHFLTWIPGPDDAVTLFNEPDAAVNANVIACLGDVAETRAAQGWLKELMAASPDEQAEALHYYPHPLDLYVAIARASEAKAPTLGELHEPVLRQMLSCQDATGTFVDVLRTAQALSALDRLGALGRDDVVQPALECLLAAQREDGSWPAGLAWIGGPGQPFSFESATLTTACCVEALERVARRVEAQAGG